MCDARAAPDYLEETLGNREYRRRKEPEGRSWHFCTNCKQWPMDGFDTSTTQVRPVCEECLSLERRQMCAKEDAYL
jgi:hypothetical protein